VVNCVCPGDCDTEMIRRSIDATSKMSTPHRNEGRLISPEEVAQAILYLVSDKARMTTGTVLILDNGATAGEGPQLLRSTGQGNQASSSTH
jgi:3-oxoacyl-[acyl-carrier protein] reductase